jgi:hypothetical protein
MLTHPGTAPSRRRAPRSVPLARSLTPDPQRTGATAW